MNIPLILTMGRILGVAAAQTCERLLRAAAGVFARREHDGTRIADIAALAGVSNGALYAHFGSKGGAAGAVDNEGAALLTRLVTALAPIDNTAQSGTA